MEKRACPTVDFRGPDGSTGGAQPSESRDPTVIFEVLVDLVPILSEKGNFSRVASVFSPRLKIAIVYR